MADIQYYLEWHLMIELAIYHLFKQEQQLLLEMKMGKFFYKKELIEISAVFICAILNFFVPFSNEIELIDTLSGKSRKNSYPNGDIVYNNTSLYLANVSMKDASNLKGDSETKRLKFFNPNEVPENLIDADLIKSYITYLNRK